MGPEGQIFVGKTLDDAVRKGLDDLGLTRAEVMITVVEEGSSGFLGLGSRPYKVRMMPRPGGAMHEPEPERDSDRRRRGGRDRDRGRGRRDDRRPRGRSDERRGGERAPVAAGGRGAERGEERRGEARGEERRGGRDERRRDERPRDERRRDDRPRDDRPRDDRPREARRDDRGRGPREGREREGREREGRERDDRAALAAEAPPSPAAVAEREDDRDEAADRPRRRRGRRGGRRRRRDDERGPAMAEPADAMTSEAPTATADDFDAGGDDEGAEPPPQATHEREGRREGRRDDRGRRGDRGGRESRRPSRGDEGPAIPPAQLAADARRATEDLLRAMGFEAKVAAEAEDTRVDVTAVVQADDDLLTGPKGEVRQALQHLLNRMINRGEGSRYHLQLEINDFWKRREEELRELARALADEAVRTDGEMVTEYLNAQERRIVHVTLKEDGRVRTYALGTGLIKRVAIAPASFPERPAEE